MYKSLKKYPFAQTCILTFYNPQSKFYTYSEELFFTTPNPILFFSRFVPPGIHMKLKFIRNNDNFVVISNDQNGKYKIKLLDLYVEFRKIVVDQSILRREIQLFDSGNPYLIQFIQGKQITRTIPKERWSYLEPELITGPLPRQIIIGFVTHASYNGSLATNPYIFENLNIKSLVFKVNGENSPPEEYTPEFNAKPLKCLRGNVQ